MTRLSLLLAVALGLLSTTALVSSRTQAQTILVNENFDSYADQAALEEVWQPFDGTGATAQTSQVGVLLPSAETATLPAPVNSPPGLMGQAISGNPNGNINQFGGSLAGAKPTETQSLVLRGDIFIAEDYTASRQTIGLRTLDIDPNAFGNNVGNLLEMGTWNAVTCDFTVEGCDTSPPGGQTEETPGYRESTQFGYRLAIFGTGSYNSVSVNGESKGDGVVPPNYQYFEFDSALDTTGPEDVPDGVVDILDIGEGWHTFKATFTETELTLELDLYRNGMNEATQSAGVDSVVNMTLNLQPDPTNPGEVFEFDSLRVNGPSGAISQTTGGDPLPAAFDNIYLALEEPSSFLPGDFNGDGFVDGGDLSLLLGNWGSNVPPSPTGWDGAQPTEPLIDASELSALLGTWGQGTPPSAASGVAPVPEPAACLLLGLASVTLFAVTRRGGSSA